MRKPEFRTLEECDAEIRRLTEENLLLREASLTFGGLAERLRMRLESEGGTGRDSRPAAINRVVNPSEGDRSRPTD